MATTPINILVFPNEVLVKIFEKLNPMSDILSCKNTCTKWRDVIEFMFKDKGVFPLVKNIFQKYLFSISG